jgi:hypothetical protein
MPHFSLVTEKGERLHEAFQKERASGKELARKGNDD